MQEMGTFLEWEHFLDHKLSDAKEIKRNPILNFAKKWVLPCHSPQLDRICLKRFEIIFLGYKLLGANTILKKYETLGTFLRNFYFCPTKLVWPC